MEEAYNSSFTGTEIDAAVAAVRRKERAWDGKQDLLSGSVQQVASFSRAGDMTPRRVTLESTFQKLMIGGLF